MISRRKVHDLVVTPLLILFPGCSRREFRSRPAQTPALRHENTGVLLAGAIGAGNRNRHHLLESREVHSAETTR
jgi:hypothetical protein